ncbi:MAG: ECF-type sigma factor [Planctomycetota bacterium]
MNQNGLDVALPPPVANADTLSGTSPGQSSPEEDASTDLTRLLQDPDLGREEKMERVLPRVYEELRALAHARMASERDGHTLDATALVNEAYLRLIGRRDLAWAGRVQFLAAAAEAMRRILIDHARRRGSKKRGGEFRRLPVSLADLAASEDSAGILAVGEAILRLEKEDSRAGAVVRLRFYGGLSIDETARALGLSERSVMREWSYARARLYQTLSDPDAREAPEN